MKKILRLIIACMFISLSVQAQNVTGVTLDHDTIILYCGEDTTLIASVIPTEAINKAVIWKTDSVAVAIIDTTSTTEEENLRCRVIADNPGETKIIVRTLNGNFRDTCVIKVIRPMTDLDLNEHVIEINFNKDSVLNAIVIPFDATNDSIIWISRDSTIVDIISTDANRYDTICHIKSLNKIGTTFIVAQTVDGGFKDSCEVIVNSAFIESFAFNSDSIDIFKGSDTTIIAMIRPLENTDKTVYWSTDDAFGRFIEITSAGFDTICDFSAVGVGRAMIFAETYNGAKKDTCVITVYGPVDSVKLNKDSLTLKINSDTSLLKATITPSFVVNDSIIWSSNDPNTVFISSPSKMPSDSMCRIEALRAGTAVILAKSVDGGIADSCVVTVVVPTDSVVLTVDKNQLDLINDTTAIVTAKFYPESATNKKLDWYNTNNSLINIDSIISDTLYYIKALWSGRDTIYAKTPEGIISDSCFIEIADRKVDSVIISKSVAVINNKDTVNMYVGDSFDVVTTVYPLNATNSLVNLVSADPSVARVDSTLTPVFIKALKPGVSKVYATPTDGLGGDKDSIIVKVANRLVTNLNLSADTIRLYKLSTEKLIASILPVNATNDSVNWSTNDAEVVSLVPSAGTDTLTITALKADTAKIYAFSRENNAIKDSCVVIVLDRKIFITADTVNVNGRIEVSIEIPEGVFFEGAYFDLYLPKGFGLSKEGNGYKTALTDAAKIFANLTITKIDESTFHFVLDPKVTSTSMIMTRAVTPVKVMDIYYTIFDNTLTDLNKVYDVRFEDLTIHLSDNTSVKENRIIKIKVFNDPTANDVFEDTDQLPAYFVDGLLYVNSDKAETVYVYSMNGTLLYMKNKTEGQAVFVINTKEKILVVKGSSGWAGKVGNR